MNAVTRHLTVAIALAPVLLVVVAGCDDDRRILEDMHDTTDYEALAEQDGLLFGFTSVGGSDNIAAGVQVTLVDENDEALSQTVVSDEDGYYEVELAPGTYRLFANGFQHTGLGAAECGDAVFGLLIESDEGVQQDLTLVCEDLD